MLASPGEGLPAIGEATAGHGLAYTRFYERFSANEKMLKTIITKYINYKGVSKNRGTP